MNNTDGKINKVHHGRNIKRFRDLLGVKQEALAFKMGEEWSQKRVSLLEQKEEIEQDIIEQVANILNVPAEAIKNFDEEAAIVNIQNNYQGSSVNSSPAYAINCTFNPIERLMESLNENKKLYERLLQSEREKVELLQGILKQGEHKI